MSSKPKHARCPQCDKPALLGPDNPWRPFCSRQCKLIDFGDWLDEFGLDPEQEPRPDRESSHENLS